MTETKILTDECISRIAKETRSAEPGRDGYVLPFAFARAIEQAVLQSLEVVAMRVINAARTAMNASFETGDDEHSISIPSDLAASLSLALDECDHARRIEENE